jgi:hypothetical protein
MKSKILSIPLLGGALILSAGCSDPDTDALKRSQHHQAVIVKPPASDPAAQKMFDSYMKTHKGETGAVPNNAPPQR